jgi:TfoX/Sxy family transcriptional regulator of competence genes
MDADATLERLAGSYLAHDGVTWGRMFSSTGLGVRGKIFAVVNHAGNLMVKVPEARVDELEAAGSAIRMVMRGREMREWVEMAPDRGEDAWSALLGEAFEYVNSITA